MPALLGPRPVASTVVAPSSTPSWKGASVTRWLHLSAPGFTRSPGSSSRQRHGATDRGCPARWVAGIRQNEFHGRRSQRGVLRAPAGSQRRGQGRPKQKPRHRGAGLVVLRFDKRGLPPVPEASAATPPTQRRAAQLVAQRRGDFAPVSRPRRQMFGGLKQNPHPRKVY